MPSDATSDVFFRCCSWHDSVTVLTANRWQLNVLAASNLYHTDWILIGKLLHYTPYRITPRSWNTSSLPKGRAALRSIDRNLGVCCVALWNFGRAFTVIWICLKDLISGCDCLSVYTHTLSSNRRHSASEGISWTVSLLLCSWTCSSSFCVITVSAVQLQTGQFVQFLYSKCAVR